jgi:Tfp pilus assembly ATPase PilU
MRQENSHTFSNCIATKRDIGFDGVSKWVAVMRL